MNRTTETQTSSSNQAHIYFGMNEGPLRSLAQRPPLVTSPATPVRDAMLQMNRAGLDNIVVVDEESNLPLGIVTQKDLVHAIAFDGRGLEQPVALLMTAAPFTLPADAPSHRASVLMTKRKVRHVVLIEANGQLANVISRSDLLGMRGGGAELLAEAVTNARDVESMAEAARNIRQRGKELFTAGMGSDSVCQWMSALNDIITMRIIELIEDEFDLPAIPWCWMVFGSEGRLEQTFSTDQDNGLIFQPSEESIEGNNELRSAFVAFAKAVNKALDACGFTLCKGNIMAGNPAWCLTLQEWKKSFDTWMSTPKPKSLLHSTIFFDFRPLYGTHELVDSLRNWLLPEPAKHTLFLRLMAEEALTCHPSLGWLNNFVYDGGSKHPHSIDLKLHGARPFVDAARIWSLTHGIWATNTGDRLRAVASVTKQPPEDTAAEIEAFNLIQRFRIQQQLINSDPEVANRIDPTNLNELNRFMLKESFKQAKKVQLRLKLEHDL